jgi:hypothetical protein
MKKLKLILASALCMGAVAMYAQDTTGVSGSQDKTGAAKQDKAGPGVGAQYQDVNPSQSQDYRKDMTVMQAADVPSSLRSTLQGEQYKGWENNSTIYRSKNNDSYIVEMREGTGTRIHRFDQNGKPVKDY